MTLQISRHTTNLESVIESVHNLTVQSAENYRAAQQESQAMDRLSEQIDELRTAVTELTENNERINRLQVNATANRQNLQTIREDFGTLTEVLRLLNQARRG